MKFITVTLNPALDMNITLPGPLQIEGLNRSEAAAFSPGGKGVNVSRALRALGCDSDAICILGGFTGARVRSMLIDEGVDVRVIATGADTRVNISLITPEGMLKGTQCEINNPPMKSQENRDIAAIRPTTETADLLAKTRLLLRRLIQKNSGERTVVIFSGSIPSDMPQNTYAELIRASASMGALTVCDCDGDALRHCLAARPDYIKPNQDELSALTERRVIRDQIPMAAQEISIATEGRTAVLATAGAQGAYLVRGRDCVFTPSVYVEKVRALKGAGDTFLAAFLYAAYVQNLKDPAALAFAARMASRKISTPDGVFPPMQA